MSWLEAAFLGLVQGLTEFLPVSSDGHLSAAQMLLPRFRQVGVLFDVLAHVGTLVAVVVYFRGLLAAEAAAFVSDVAEDRLGARRLAALVVIATLPTAVIGLLLKPVVELAKWDPRFVGGMEVATGLAVATWMIPRRGARRELAGMRVADAVAIGIAQGLAVLPGLSRSATTIAVGLALGLSGLSAARFSLLAALPAILGAAGLELLSAWDERGSGFFATGDFAKYLLAAVVAGGVGYLTIGWLVRLASNRRVIAFAVYCILFGAALFAAGRPRRAEALRREVAPHQAAAIPALGVAARHPDDSVDPDAAEEREREPGVEAERLVLEDPRKAREQHQEVDRVAGQDRREVLDPSTRGHHRESTPASRARSRLRSGSAEGPV